MKLPRPERSTLVAGGVFAAAAVLYLTIGVDTADSPATPAIPVYVVTTVSTTAPATTVPTPTTEPSDTTAPEPSEPGTTLPADIEVEDSSVSGVTDTTSPAS